MSWTFQDPTASSCVGCPSAELDDKRVPTEIEVARRAAAGCVPTPRVKTEDLDRDTLYSDLEVRIFEMSEPSSLC